MHSFDFYSVRKNVFTEIMLITSSCYYTFKNERQCVINDDKLWIIFLRFDDFIDLYLRFISKLTMRNTIRYILQGLEILIVTG